MAGFDDKIKNGHVRGGVRMLLSGMDKVGKSTFGATAPDPVFACSESGLVGPQFIDTPNHVISSWVELIEFAKWVKESNKYKTFVLDTIDWMESKLVEHILAFNGLETLAGDGKGKNGYVLLGDEWKRFLMILDQLSIAGTNIILIAHTQLKPYSNPIGPDYDRYFLQCDKRIASMTCQWVDIKAFAMVESFSEKMKGSTKYKAVGSDAHLLRTSTSPLWEAGGRWTLPDPFPLSDWNSFAQAIKESDSQAEKKILADRIYSIITAATHLPKEKTDGALAALNRDKDDSTKLRVLLNKVSVAFAATEGN